MSGRWRSRHWRPGDDTPQHRGDRYAEQRYDNGHHGGGNYHHHHHGRQSSWNDDGRVNNYYHQQQQHQEYAHDQYYDYRRDDMGHSNMYVGNYNYYNEPQRGGGQWQWGQNIPHRNSNRRQQQQQRGNDARDGKRQQNNRGVKNSSQNAWGKQPLPAAAKPDHSNLSSVDARTANAGYNQSKIPNNSERDISRSKTNKNVWSKPDIPPSAGDSSNAVEFPSLSNNTNTKESSSTNETKPSNNNHAKMMSGIKQEVDHNQSSVASSSLPTASSWGKSHSSWGLAAKQSQPSEKLEKKKGEEYPSLSASLVAPRKQQNISAKNASIEDKPKKGGSNKKSAAASSANLASFLPPQLGDANTEKKKSNSNKKQQQPMVNKSTASNKKKHAREETRPPINHHGAFALNTHHNGAPPIKKGRQRLGPRKKKLTTLKKRVLEERLRVWKERNGEVSDTNQVSLGDGQSINVSKEVINANDLHHAQSTANIQGNKMSTTLLVRNFINPEEDDLNDDDEHDEIVSNLINLAGRVGKVVSVCIPRPSSDNNDGGGDESALEESKHVGLSFVRLGSYQDAHAARDILDGMVVGGERLITKILHSVELEACDSELIGVNLPSPTPSEENEQHWRCAVLKAVIADQTLLSSQEQLAVLEDVNGNISVLPSRECSIVFHNILCSDDYEDEDALEESVEDIKCISGQHGHVVNARGDDAGNVYVTYDTEDLAAFAATKLDGMLLGGMKIFVTVDADSTYKHTVGSATVVLSNVLTDDDFEDDDCMNESIQDIRTLAEKFGIVGSVRADASNEEEKGKVHVEYTGDLAVAVEATRQLNGMMFGGRIISATLLSPGVANTAEDNNHANPPTNNANVEQEAPAPIFSGDKIIPERFAQCKRVPKVANSGTPRAYATKIADERAMPLLTEILGELMRLQQRSKDDKNARSRRRLVMGLREVARGIRAHKVKMVVMANNLDEYGAIDSKLQEILDLAQAEEVPVLFELNKRKLGKAVGKSIKVSVVGIQNVSGAEQQFKQLKRIANL